MTHNGSVKSPLLDSIVKTHPVSIQHQALAEKYTSNHEVIVSIRQP